MGGGARATRRYYPKQDKRVFREAGCLPEGDTMVRGWQVLRTEGCPSCARFMRMSVTGHLLRVRVDNLPEKRVGRQRLGRVC